MATTRFKIASPPPRRLTVAETAAKYKLSKAAAQQVARYLNYRVPLQSTSEAGVASSRAKKRGVARKAR
jgi:hypothetical protein